MDTRSELEGAWKETVKEDYLNGTIATERDLQASIYRGSPNQVPGRFYLS